MSEVSTAIKTYFGEDIPGPASLIQLYDQQEQFITDLDDIAEDYYKKLKGGGLYLAIRTSPPPYREPSMNDLFAAGSTSSLSAKLTGAAKRSLSFDQ